MSTTKIDGNGTINNGKVIIGPVAVYSAVTTAQTSNAFNIGAARGLAVAVNLSSLTGTFQLRVEQQRRDGTWYPLAHSATRSTTGSFIVEFGPGLDVDLRLNGSMSVRVVYLLTGTATYTANVAGI